MTVDKASHKISGFTIVEMIIIAPIVLLAIGAFITAIVSMTGDVLASRSSNSLAYNIQDTLSRIETDVKLSSTFLATNKVTLTSPQGYDNSTATFSNIGANGNMLILSSTATTGNPLDATSGIVYLAGKPNSCFSSNLSDNTPLLVNIVYFIKDRTLWRRVIMPADYATSGIACNTPWQQPSCNSDFMKDNPSSSTFCKTQDEKLIEDIDPEDIDFQYYTSASSNVADSVAITSSDESTRASALQADTTLTVSINIDKTAAGRDISQSGAIRATRLDINAASIATVTPDIVPDAPTISADPINPSTPTTVSFSWPTVPGATTYTLDYRLDTWNPVTLSNSTGSWTNEFTSQNTLTFSKTISHGDKLNIRVTANSPAGSSSYGTTSLTVPVWTPLFLQNGWTTFNNSYATPSFTKTSSGMVILKGMARSGTATVNTVIANLPVGYRPTEQLLFENTSNGNPSRVDITAAGNISFQTGTSSDYYFDGISFMPSGTTFNTLSLQNSWVWFGSPYAQIASMVDGSGRVQLKGLVKSGSTTSGNTIATLPAGSWPSEYLHIVNINNNASAHISVNSSGNVLYKKGGNSFQSMQATFFPSSRVDGATCTSQWCTPTLLNSWVHYGSPYATPRYTKASDGMVHLKGLIRSGTTTAGTPLINLPAGYCPKQNLLLTTEAADAWARLQVTPGTGSGCQLLASYVSATWTSLDAAKWLAEW